MKWLLRGGTLVDPSTRTRQVSDVLIEGTAIAAVASRIDVGDDCPVEDVTGLLVCPGFVDMHVHLREPGREDKETIETGTRAAARGGFVAVGVMPNTTPSMDDPAHVTTLLERARQVSPVRVLPIPCITRGQAGTELVDMPSLVAAGAVAFSDDGRGVMDARVMRQALEQARALERTLVLHEEDHDLSLGAHAHEGEPARALGIPGIPGVAEDVMVARDLILAEATGARIHVAHISTARSVRLVREARARGVRVTAEVTPHHLLLTDQALLETDDAERANRCKMNPPLRSEADRQALIEGLRDGTIDAIATDHAPHTQADKAAGFDRAPFGVIGLETAVPVVLDAFLPGEVVPLHRLVDAFSLAPARILGLGATALAPGNSACITVIDASASETIDPAAFESKSRNCPFAGWQVRGIPVLTVVEGRIVMRGRRLVPPPTPEHHRP